MLLYFMPVAAVNSRKFTVPFLNLPINYRVTFSEQINFTSKLTSHNVVIQFLK